MMLKTSARSGLTLIEVLITVVIIGVVASMASIGVNLTNSLTKRKMISEVERDTQVTLFMIAKDIRNSNSIFDLASDGNSVSVRSFNYTNGYDVDTIPNLFSPTNISTITYAFVKPTSEPSRLVRKIEQNGVVIEEKHFLKGLLDPDNPKTTGVVEGVFTPSGVADPIRSVLVNLRVGHGLLEENPLTYSAQATLRGQKDD